MPATVNFKGNPQPLKGTEVKVGQQAPAFKARKSLVDDATLADFAGKTLIIIAVPSVDTGICDKEGRRFNLEANSLGDDVKMLLVSADLPPAQGRWCGAAEVKNLTMLSDYRHREFGEKYGCFVDTLGVLSRCVFVVDKSGKVTYAEYVPEIAQEPNYDAALAAAKAAK